MEEAKANEVKFGIWIEPEMVNPKSELYEKHSHLVIKQPIKFRTDVAMMRELGFDIVVDELEPNDLEFCQQVIENYNAIKQIIWQSDQYRLAILGGAVVLAVRPGGRRGRISSVFFRGTAGLLGLPILSRCKPTRFAAQI